MEDRILNNRNAALVVTPDQSRVDCGALAPQEDVVAIPPL